MSTRQAQAHHNQSTKSTIFRARSKVRAPRPARPARGYSGQPRPAIRAARTPHPPFSGPRPRAARRILLVWRKMSEVFSLGHKQPTSTPSPFCAYNRRTIFAPPKIAGVFSFGSSPPRRPALEQLGQRTQRNTNTRKAVGGFRTWSRATECATFRVLAFKTLLAGPPELIARRRNAGARSADLCYTSVYVDAIALDLLLGHCGLRGSCVACVFQ